MKLFVLILALQQVPGPSASLVGHLPPPNGVLEDRSVERPCVPRATLRWRGVEVVSDARRYLINPAERIALGLGIRRTVHLG